MKRLAYLLLTLLLAGGLARVVDAQVLNSTQSVAAANVIGALGCSNQPALTGDTTNTAGSCATTTTKTGGVAFATSATTDTTNASNISAGSLATARIATIASGLTGVLPLANGGTNQSTGATSLCMGTSASVAAATTDFIACGENPGVTVIASEANDQQLIPAACTVSRLFVTVTAAANTNTPVITVDKNTTGQTLTCTVLNAATTCNDTTHSFTTVAGDLLSVKVANPTSANATGVIYMGFQINC